jgi:hypothetical protein
MNDPFIDAVDVLTMELATFLEGKPPPVVCAALAYTLAAMIARQARLRGDITLALELVDQWTGTMKNQIKAFGIDQDHP